MNKYEGTSLVLNLLDRNKCKNLEKLLDRDHRLPMRLKNIILLTAATWRFRHSGVDRKKTLQEHFRARIFAIFLLFALHIFLLK